MARPDPLSRSKGSYSATRPLTRPPESGYRPVHARWRDVPSPHLLTSPFQTSALKALITRSERLPRNPLTCLRSAAPLIDHELDPAEPVAGRADLPHRQFAANLRLEIEALRDVGPWPGRRGRAGSSPPRPSEEAGNPGRSSPPVGRLTWSYWSVHEWPTDTAERFRRAYACSASQRSASMAAEQPDPAAVMACR